MTPARPMVAKPFVASLAALGVTGIIAVPAPALAANPGCTQPERYAAQSGAELLKVTELTVRPNGKPGGGRPSGGDRTPDGAATRERSHSAPGSGRGPGASVASGEAVAPKGTGEHGPVAKPAPAEKPGSVVKPSGGSLLGAVGEVAGVGGGTGGRGGGATGGQGGGAPQSGGVTGSGVAGSGGGQGGGGAAMSSGGQGGGAAGSSGVAGRDGGQSGDESILGGAAGAATSPTPALGGSNVAGRHDENGRLSTGRRRTVTVSGVHVGEARSAMVGVGRPNAAAVTRMINSSAASGASAPVVRQAPPNGGASERDTPAAEAGPVLLDDGSLVADARWQDAMACGEAYGDITEAAATLGAAQVSGTGRAALVAVPEEVRSVSTTALERTGQGARVVAAAKFSARSFELLDGAVQIEVLRSPSLTTRMSTVEGGDVSYVPAAIRVSGDGIKTTKLDAPGDSMELTFSERQTESLSMPDLGGKTLGELPLPLPTIPGLPRLPDSQPRPESVPTPDSEPGTGTGSGTGSGKGSGKGSGTSSGKGSSDGKGTRSGESSGSGKGSGDGNGTSPGESSGTGTTVTIRIGQVRQASQGRAIAAKASAISVGVAQGGTADDRYGRSADVTLDMEIGALESASMAPEPVGGAVAGAAYGGRGGGLPVTGPGVAAIVVIGGALVASGVVAFVLGRRRRRFEA